MPSTSCTTLGKILAREGVVNVPFTTADMKAGRVPRHISNETYGRKSCVYVSTESPAARRVLENKLEREGFKVNRRYWKGSSTLEVLVRYFRGRKWDE